MSAAADDALIARMLAEDAGDDGYGDLVGEDDSDDSDYEGEEARRQARAQGQVFERYANFRQGVVRSAS